MLNCSEFSFWRIWRWISFYDFFSANADKKKNLRCCFWPSFTFKTPVHSLAWTQSPITCLTLAETRTIMIIPPKAGWKITFAKCLVYVFITKLQLTVKMMRSHWKLYRNKRSKLKTLEKNIAILQTCVCCSTLAQSRAKDHCHTFAAIFKKQKYYSYPYLLMILLDCMLLPLLNSENLMRSSLI